MSTTADVRRTGYAKTAIEKTALIVGIVFLLVGIAGFIPGLTTNAESMEFAGHESEALLLGVFQVSILHNVVHLLFGVVGIAVAGNSRASRAYLIWGGVIYAVLWLYGLFTGDSDSSANFVPLNSADNWLHLVLALGMILLGLFVGRDRSNRTRTV
ncbi:MULTISPECIES: DUF4383 domain-containing protein [unclassified Leifsonia]|uniref:DUF4383 domain-containing protein n=1 Tax=unclassified Leifsonia TaxID=2663824 RepID=UPI0006FC352D|nr:MULTISPECIES: DUF4383 domain-containing protein [unclassified Leifsonia]KQX08403.1 hypothetical protein ASC59_03535 [Leifsonia sp. Root1293]KRA12685.1 hypothetical protein ASD61_03535 [Leifsonia sp. Root60]